MTQNKKKIKIRTDLYICTFHNIAFYINNIKFIGNQRNITSIPYKSCMPLP